VLGPRTGGRAVRLLAAALFAGTVALTAALVPEITPPAGARDIGSSTWAGLEPVAYGNAQLDLPASWPVVADGTGPRRHSGTGPVQGVVLLGTFGSSSCALHASNIVRLGPLPAGEPPYSSLAKVVRNGVTPYAVVLHGHISGTAYLVPSLGVEVMATGPAAGGVLSSSGRSVREQVLAAIRRNPITMKAPRAWRTVDFGGLRFAVSPSPRVTLRLGQRAGIRSTAT